MSEKKRPPGRPKGSRNKFSRKAAEDLAKEAGMLPHEFLARVALGPTFFIGEEDFTPTLGERMIAAKAAAPYYAPKQHSIKVERTPPNEMDDASIIDELKVYFDVLKKKIGET